MVKKSFAEIKEINIDAGLNESFTKESGKYDNKSLLNNCIIFVSLNWISSSFLY